MTHHGCSFIVLVSSSLFLLLDSVNVALHEPQLKITLICLLLALCLETAVLIARLFPAKTFLVV